MFKSKKEEEDFLQIQKRRFQNLTISDIKVNWITFLCHKEITSQGDINEHLHFSHKINIKKLEDHNQQKMQFSSGRRKKH